MPVGKQLNYWDGTDWVAHVAPTGVPGIKGAEGPPAIRPTAGGCGFICNANRANYVNGSGAVVVTGMKAIPGMQDLYPALTIKDTQTLVVARAGTILINFKAGAGTTVVGVPVSFVQIGSPHIVRMGIAQVGEDTVSAMAVIPNAPIGFELLFYWEFNLVTSPAVPDGIIHAAWTP